MAAQFEAVLKGFRFQAASEARALDAWAAPESEFKADEAFQQLMDKVTVRAIEEQSAGAPFTFTGARVVSSTVESAHRPESGDSFRTIPAMGQVQYVFKYKVQYKLENKPQELEATVTVDAGFYGMGDKFLASKFEVR